MISETFSVGQWNLLNYEREGDFEARYERVLGLERVRGLDVFFAQEVVDVDLFTRIALSNGFRSVVVGSPVDSGEGEQRVAIASKTELESRYDLGFLQGAKTVSRGVTWNLFSAHLEHGSREEGRRYFQARVIDGLAGNLEEGDPESVTVLGGDLNALPDSKTLRYLRGLDLDKDGGSTLWVDAWETAGQNVEEGTNNHGRNKLGMETARRCGSLWPELIPDRRVDYIMVRGWRYGLVGCPVGFFRLNDWDGEYSDHEGIGALLAVRE